MNEDQKTLVYSVMWMAVMVESYRDGGGLGYAGTLLENYPSTRKGQG